MSKPSEYNRFISPFLRLANFLWKLAPAAIRRLFANAKFIAVLKIIGVCLAAGGVLWVVLCLSGCVSSSVHWDSETIKPDGTVVRTKKGYDYHDNRAFGDAVGQGAVGLSTMLNESGLASLNPIVGGISGLLGAAGGWLARRTVARAADKGWDDAAKTYGPPPGSAPGVPVVVSPVVPAVPLAAPQG